MKKTRIILCLLLNVMVVSPMFLSFSPASAIGGTDEGEISENFLHKQTTSDDLLSEKTEMVTDDESFPGSYQSQSSIYSRTALFEISSNIIYGFVSPGTHEYAFTVQNSGSSGSDRIEFDFPFTGWSFTLYEPDGITPLTDTNSDGTIDTGLLAEGEIKTIVSKVTVPPTAVVGDYLQGSFSATSELNPGLSQSIQVSLAIPSPFAQIYYSNEEGLQLTMVESNRSNKYLLADKGPGYDPAVIETLNGKLINIWSEFRCSETQDDNCHREIKYAVFDHNGQLTLSTTSLTNFSDFIIMTYDESPAVTALFDGNVGLTWYRLRIDTISGVTNFNIYFAVFDQNGTLIQGPINLTNNEYWGSYESGNIYLTNPTISATDDGNVILAWEHKDSTSGSGTNDIFYGIYDTEGTEEFSAIKVGAGLTNYKYESPILTLLQNGNILLNWIERYDITGSYTPQFLVLDHEGNVMKTKTYLSGEAQYSGDVVQLPDGRIFLVWRGLDNEIIYSILDGLSYVVLLPSTKLVNPISANNAGQPSVTFDQDGHAILTWCGSPSTSDEDDLLYYSLIGGDGLVITPPTIMAASDYLISSFNGMGNTTFSPIDSQNSPPVIYSNAVIKATQDDLYSYNILASDPDPADEDSLILSAPTIPEWLMLNDNGDGTGMLSGTPTSENIGSHPVELVVTDSDGRSDTQSFTIVVESKDDLNIYLPLIIF